LHQRKKFQHRKRGKKVAAQERFLPQESDRRTPETRSIDLKIHQEVMIRTRTWTSWHRKKEHTREVEEGKEEEAVLPERTASEVEIVTSPSPPYVVVTVVPMHILAPHHPHAPAPSPLSSP
jgi:hypothetical protein